MPKLIAVLGMHRSGTSVIAGTLQEHGIELGPASESNPFNPRGNREISSLRKLHERILERSGGSWWQPPAAVTIEDRHRARRDRILAGIPGERIGVKDPRMLLLLDLWRELEPVWIGVIRNPVAVRESLERRARERGKPSLSGEAWEELWRHYNRLLLDEMERERFPIVDFDRPDELDAQVRAALAFHGIESHGTASFYDPELIGKDHPHDWHARALSAKSVELWDRLRARTVVPL